MEKKLPRGEVRVLNAIKVINELVDELINDIKFDPDAQYELGKAWGITKDYLNVKETN